MKTYQVMKDTFYQGKYVAASSTVNGDDLDKKYPGLFKELPKSAASDAKAASIFENEQFIKDLGVRLAEELLNNEQFVEAVSKKLPATSQTGENKEPETATPQTGENKEPETAAPQTGESKGPETTASQTGKNKQK